MKKNILCFSRSYLSKLYPTLGLMDNGNIYYYIVLTNTEEKRVTELGGTVVLNLESAVRKGIKINQVSNWVEPDDFRSVTGFEWSPIYSDRYLVEYPHSKRLKIAGIVFSAIEEVFKRYSFDYFLSEPVALYSTHVMYYFCKKMNVEPRLGVSTFFPGYFFFCDTMDYSRPLVKINKSSEILTDDNIFIREFCENITRDKAGPAYHFSFSTDKKKNIPYLKQRTGDTTLALTPSIMTVLLQFARLIRAACLRISFPVYGDYQSSASLKEHWFYFKCLLTRKKYYDDFPLLENDAILYSLQYEPEASLLYAGPNFYNQVHLVEMILRGMPNNKILYVKEHPNQFGALGMRRWKKLRKKYHNLRFIYGRESGRELMKKCLSVISVTSTAGMDAILMGKPVLVGGRVFYQKFPNVVEFSSVGELPKLLNDLKPGIDNKNDVMDKVVDELSYIYRNSYKGIIHPSDKLYSKDNLELVVEAINDACP